VHQVVFIYKIYKMFPPVCRNFEVILENNGISLARHNRHGGSVRTAAATDVYTVSGSLFCVSVPNQTPTDPFLHVVTNEMSLRDLM